MDMIKVIYFSPVFFKHLLIAGISQIRLKKL